MPVIPMEKFYLAKIARAEDEIWDIEEKLESIWRPRFSSVLRMWGSDATEDKFGVGFFQEHEEMETRKSRLRECVESYQRCIDLVRKHSVKAAA